FKNDFLRDCNTTLDNVQEWIKAELPIVTDHIDATAIKDELKQAKISSRRKHLLSALLFEKCTRESIVNNNASTAAIMAIHMFNHIWQTKVELYGSLPLATATSNTVSVTPIPDKTYNDTREKILNSLIEKSEKLKSDSLIQKKVEDKAKNKDTPLKSKQVPNLLKTKKPIMHTKKKVDAWTEEIEKDKQRKLSVISSNKKQNKKTNKSKKNSGSVLSRVATKLPLKRRKKSTSSKVAGKQDNSLKKYQDDDLYDNPNLSAIMVNPGFSDSIEDSLIQERKNLQTDPNSSGVTVHKFLKTREHEKQEPGSNTIIMKLASGASRRSEAKLSLPEQCQEAINILTEQFPGYDMVAIRNLAAKKVGVSPQYIMNLNILPEKTG
ncbi:MAG: hypothetical protein P8X88_03560, partial [Gammaproteobacteria bacterium]